MNNRGRGASTGALAGDSFQRVRDRMAATEASKPEVARPKSPEELTGDYYYNLHLQRQAEAKAKEAAEVAARQKRRAAEQAAKEQNAKRARLTFVEQQIEREVSDFSQTERGEFYQKLADANKLDDIVFASITAEQIRLNREETKDEA
jgi:hypothetical protein